MAKFLNLIAPLTCAVAIVAAGPAAAQSVQLEVDQTQPLRFERPVTGVVVGNASIADVIVHDPRVIFVVGKSVGTTDVLAVDKAGRTVFSGTVNVRATNVKDMVTIQRGKEISTAICRDRCIPNVHPEGTPNGNAPAVAAISGRTAFASGGGGGRQ